MYHLQTQGPIQSESNPRQEQEEQEQGDQEEQEQGDQEEQEQGDQEQGEKEVDEQEQEEQGEPEQREQEQTQEVIKQILCCYCYYNIQDFLNPELVAYSFPGSSTEPQVNTPHTSTKQLLHDQEVLREVDELFNDDDNDLLIEASKCQEFDGNPIVHYVDLYLQNVPLERQPVFFHWMSLSPFLPPPSPV